MLSHIIGIFYKTGNVIILGDYPYEDNVAYLRNFMDVSFNSDRDVQSIGFQLQLPHQNRLANIYLYDRPANEVIEINNKGKKVEPMAGFQLKLSQDGRNDIWPIFGIRGSQLKLS
jgi:hypothetical protein